VDTNRTIFYCVCILCSLCVLAIDLMTPLGVAGGVPYVGVITLSLWTKNKNHVIFLGLFSTALTTVGFFLSPPYVDLWIVLLNRTYAIISIWIVVFLIIKLFTLLEEAVMQSEVDPLTGLKNRTYLYKHGDLILSLYNRKQSPVSLVFIDLDDFKCINDTYGHQMGDSFLKKVGEVLNKHCRKTDIVSRIGGDEFVILMPDTTSFDAFTITEKIHRSLKRNCLLKSAPNICFKGSFGVASTLCQDAKGAQSIDELILQADKALYQVKREGKNDCKIFSLEAGTAI